VSVAELLADLRSRGVEFKVVGDRLRYHPRSSATTENVAALRAHKAEIVEALAVAASNDQHWLRTLQEALYAHGAHLELKNGRAVVVSPGALSGAVMAIVDAHQDYLVETLKVIGQDDWVSTTTSDGVTTWVHPDYVDYDWGEECELPPPCPKCDSLEVWWDPWDDTHCLHCDPPTESRELRVRAARIRKRLGIEADVGPVGE
jgi:hypothetical protein